MKDFLFEVFSEEIPAVYQEEAEKNIIPFVEKHMHPLQARSIQAFVSPQRVAFILNQLYWPEKSMVEKEGPLVNQGEKALQGFCKSIGTTSVCQKDTEKGLIWIASIEKGFDDPTPFLIALCQHFLHHFSWPKRMHWGPSLSWVRPIRALLCLYGQKLLPWSYHGLHTNIVTKSHRFFHPAKKKAPEIALAVGSVGAHIDKAKHETHDSFTEPVVIKEASTYVEQMRQAKVLVNATERRQSIALQLKELSTSCKSLPCAKNLDSLIVENAALTQWPTAILGTFDPSFLALPEPVITAVLNIHQRCFALRDETTHHLIPHFVAILDTLCVGADIGVGYERVVQARLSDALFFWQQDQKKPLLSYNHTLKSRLFFNQLGSIYDKVQRLQALAPVFASLLACSPEDLMQAAALAKADLATSMVGEFPSLQGMMGRYYAEYQGTSAHVALALEDLYAEIPSSRLGAALALMDGLDSLVGFFALSKIPSGSKDPMGLRRLTYRILHAIQKETFSFSLEKAISLCLEAYHHQKLLLDTQALPSLIQFFMEKLYSKLKDQGIPLACLAVALDSKTDDLWQCIQQATQWHQFTQSLVGQNFLKAYRRVHSLLRQMQGQEFHLDRDLLQTQQEKALLDLLTYPLSSAYAQKDLLHQCARWIAPLHDFFDNVRINDPVYQHVRLALIHEIERYFRPLGSFSIFFNSP